jgi:hypothetical protein
MTTDLARRDEQRALTSADPEQAAAAIAQVLGPGDLSALSNQQRVAFYLEKCRSLGLNPLSRPFDWLVLDGKLVLYDNRSCAEQLRRQHQISIKITRRDVIGQNTDDPLFVVEVEGRRPNGQTDQASKYVPLTVSKQGHRYRLSGRELANAYAKAETGAKRRLTFSMVGMAAGPDPDELSNARRVIVDGEGHIITNPTDEERELAERPDLARVIGVPTYETTAAAADVESPLVPEHSQAARPDELAPARRTVERQSFKPSSKDVERWLGAWFATVKGLAWDSDDARHAVVRDWTHGRYTSLRQFFEHATSQQAGEFLNYVRDICAAERAELQALIDEQSSAPEEDQETFSEDD